MIINLARLFVFFEEIMTSCIIEIIRYFKSEVFRIYISLYTYLMACIDLLTKFDTFDGVFESVGSFLSIIRF